MRQYSMVMGQLGCEKREIRMRIRMREGERKRKRRKGRVMFSFLFISCSLCHAWLFSYY